MKRFDYDPFAEEIGGKVFDESKNGEYVNYDELLFILVGKLLKNEHEKVISEIAELKKVYRDYDLIMRSKEVVNKWLSGGSDA